MKKFILLFSLLVAVVVLVERGKSRSSVDSMTSTIADAPGLPTMVNWEESLLETPSLVADEGRITSPALEKETEFVYGRLPPADLADMVPSEKIRRLEQRLLSEKVDPEWATPLESELYASIASIGLPVSYVTAECKTTICRIDVVADVRGLIENGGSFRELVTREATTQVAASDVRLNGGSGMVIPDNGAGLGVAMLYAYQMLPEDKPAPFETSAESIEDVDMQEILRELARRSGYAVPETSEFLRINESAERFTTTEH